MFKQVTAEQAERIAALEKRAAFLDGVKRKRAAALIFLGSLFGMFGFFFAFVTGLMKSTGDASHWDSGEGYFPSTVSEMVSDRTGAAGKAFFAFEFIAAVFIFISWYPYQLSNVYIGDDDTGCGGLSWVLLRQFIPAPGMMLVATVSTTPIQIATIRDDFTIFIHLSGAMMMFAGYIMIEAKTLGLLCFTHPTIPVATRITEDELKWRKVFLMIVTSNYVGFFCLQIVLGFPGIDNYVCCNDIYSHEYHPPRLMNTAHSGMLGLKVLSYLSEVICGMSLIMSHFTIWYYCEERHTDLDETIIKMGELKDEFNLAKKFEGRLSPREPEVSGSA